MGFGFGRSWGLLLVVMLFGIRAAASAGRKGTEIAVLVYDSVQIPLSVLDQAERDAATIFRTAGVEVRWVNCSNGSALVDDSCHHVPGSNQLVLHIVPRGKTSTDLVFGLSFLDEDGTGKYSDVFFDRIADAGRAFGANPSRLLGAVAAHELGHLLLGSHAHSCIGIMTPQWEKQTLRSLNRGRLLFTPEQASRMQARIRRDDLGRARFPPGSE
jgi:hypothetical protein